MSVDFSKDLSLETETLKAKQATSSLNDFHILSFRNLTNFKVQNLSKANLIIGPNGVGKTSILEAIYFLSLGRSFRTSLFKKIIQNEQDHFIVQASLMNGSKLGIQKNYDGGSIIRIDEETKKNIAENALLLPVQVIDPEAFSLLQSGPEARRKFFDWGVYQAFPHFYDYWREYQRLLRQRNAAIRNQMPLEMIVIWDPQLIKVTKTIDLLRRAYLERFSPVFSKYFETLLGDAYLSIDLNYHPGWRDDYAEALSGRVQRDLELGYTFSGPHRFDLKIKTESGCMASDFFSRGQQKLTVIALKLAQAALCSEEKQKKVIFLLDDIAAELDAVRRNQLADLLKAISCQYFITGVEPVLLKPFELPDCCSIKIN